MGRIVVDLPRKSVWYLAWGRVEDMYKKRLRDLTMRRLLDLTMMRVGGTTRLDTRNSMRIIQVMKLGSNSLAKLE